MRRSSAPPWHEHQDLPCVSTYLSPPPLGSPPGLPHPHKARQFLMQKLLHLPLAEFELVTLLTRVLVECGNHHSQSLFQWTGHLESGETKEHHRGTWGLKSSLQGLLLLHQAYPLRMARRCLHPALEVCSLRSRVHTATSHCTQMINLSWGPEPPKAGPRILGTHLFGEASLLGVFTGGREGDGSRLQGV